MPLSYQPETFEESSARFTSAISWLESFGIKTSPTRYGSYARDLKELSISDPGRLKGKEAHFLEAIYESSELISIHQELQNIEVKGLKDSLKKLVKGPVRRVDEPRTGGAILARNTGFELTVASRLSSVGLIPDLSQRQDVALDYAGHKLFVECKRPSSESKIVTRLDEALKQCKRQLESCSTSRASGIVALDCSRLENPESNYLQLPNVHVIDSTMRDLVRRFQDEYMPRINMERHRKVIAVMVYFSGIVVNLHKSSVNHVQQWSYMKNSYSGAGRQLVSNMLSQELVKAMRENG